jgi:succinyl-diaminopimelate desuccinylase
MSADSLASLLVTLVDIPSVTGQEAALADLVAGRLRWRGTGDVLRSDRSVIWRGPRRGRPLVILAGHLDTVPPEGDSTARIENGRVIGRGASDMKGGVAVMLALIEALDPARLRFDLAAVFYDGEEGPHESNGLGRVLRESPWLNEARLAILLEPTDAQVELGCNGMMNAEVRVAGRSAHAARPWTGVNAIERAAPWLAEIVRFPVTPVMVQGLEFRETLQVTVLRAGRTKNVLPDELVANLNHRFPPGRTPDEAAARLRALVPDGFDFRVTDQAAPGLVCLDQLEVREFVERFGLGVAGKQGWTDVARFTGAGIAAFNFGPGLSDQCHVPGEYCPVANLERVYDVLSHFLTEEGR